MDIVQKYNKKITEFRHLAAFSEKKIKQVVFLGKINIISSTRCYYAKKALEISSPYTRR